MPQLPNPSDSTTRGVTTLLPFAVFCTAFAIFLLFCFYATPVREAVERKLYDLRTRMKWAAKTVDDVVILKVDQQTIDALAGEGAENLSYAQLIEAIQKMQLLDAQAFVVFLYPHIFDYESPELSNLASMMAEDPRLFLAIQGRDTQYPTVLNIPDVLLPVAERVAGIEIYHDRRFEFVRKVPLYSSRSDGVVSLMPLRLARKLRGKVDHLPSPDTEATFWLNYYRPSQLRQFKAELLWDEEAAKELAIVSAHTVVFLGYTVYRERTLSPNQMFVNTPWQQEGGDVAEGMPLIYVTAMAYLNLYFDTWLKDASLGINILQTAIVSVLSACVWLIGITPAIFLLLVLWSAVFYIHSLLFSYLNLFVPMADTVMFGSLAVMFGGILRSVRETRERTAHQVRARSLRDLSHVQADFLLAFSRQLDIFNNAVIGHMGQLVARVQFQDNAAKIVRKLRASVEDFRDYLRRMGQFALLEDEKLRHIQTSKVLVYGLIVRVLDQFHSRTQEANLIVTIECDKFLEFETDENFLEPILFNFVSNAIKYSPQQGQVKISVRLSSRGELCIDVSDQGPGIEEQYYDQVFEKFFRIDDERLHKVKGSGLGLFLCKFFADRLGAQLILNSRVGYGSTFGIRLPSHDSFREVKSLF